MSTSLKNSSDPITLAIPNKGRLYDDTIDLLKKCGIQIYGESLSCKTSHPCVHVLFARAGDIPKYVERGTVPCGITGYDMVQEARANVSLSARLGFGRCAISLAVREDFSGTLKDLAGKTIATRLTNIAHDFLKKEKINATILTVEGSSETTLIIGAADAIIDQVQTGKTLAQNRLRVLHTLFESEACFIVNKNYLTHEVIEELRLAFDGINAGKGKKYIMANVPSKEILDKIIRVVPAADSPTVLSLAKEGEYAIHSVVPEQDLGKTIRLLKSAGAKDILVLSIEKLIP